MKRIATFLLFLLLAQAAIAQQYTMPVKINTDANGISDRSPLMRLDRNGNIYIAWVEAPASGGGAIYMSRSNDGGTTYTSPVTVCSDANCNADYQRTAQYIIDTNGTIHMVWMGNRVNNQPDVWYVRSTDRGASWTTPVSLCDAGDSSKFAQDFPSIACDSSNNLYVSFLDARLRQQNLSTNMQLYFTRSTDGGLTWSANIKADSLFGGIGGTCECCSEKIAAAGNGHIFIVFRSNINNIRDIWLERSSDGGRTFEPALQVQSGDWYLEACPVSGPNLALDDSEGAHIVWRDARDDSGGVSHTYYAYVPKGSTTIPENTAFDATGAQTVNYPDISLFENGKYRAIVYQTFNFGMRYILFDGSSQIVRNRPIPSGISQQFGTVLFAPDGTRYISWQDNKNDNGDIYFCKETTPLTSEAVQRSLLQNTFTINPNPTTDGSVNVTSSLSAPASLQILDMLGRVIYRTPLQAGTSSSSILLHIELPAGIYECVLNGSGIRMTQILVNER